MLCFRGVHRRRRGTLRQERTCSWAAMPPRKHSPPPELLSRKERGNKKKRRENRNRWHPLRPVRVRYSELHQDTKASWEREVAKNVPRWRTGDRLKPQRHRCVGNDQLVGLGRSCLRGDPWFQSGLGEVGRIGRTEILDFRAIYAAPRGPRRGQRAPPEFKMPYVPRLCFCVFMRRRAAGRRFSAP